MGRPDLATVRLDVLAGSVPTAIPNAGPEQNAITAQKAKRPTLSMPSQWPLLRNRSRIFADSPISIATFASPEFRAVPICRQVFLRNRRLPLSRCLRASLTRFPMMFFCLDSRVFLHPPPAGAAQEAAVDLIMRCENSCAKKFTGAADNVRHRQLWSSNRRREAELSIILFSGKFITCPPRLKSKFGSRSRMSCSSTCWLFEAFD